MSKNLLYVPDAVRAALDEAGVPWEAAAGRKHTKILIGGRLAAVLPRTLRGREAPRHVGGNLIAAVRRAAAAYKSKENQ